MPDPEHIMCPHCGAVNRVPAGRHAEAAHCGSCHRPLFTGHPIEVSEAAFERHIHANSIPVLVDVWAPWCGPCRVMAPEFDRAAAGLEPHVRLLKLNADSAHDTCARLGVRSIPALFLFHGGGLVSRIEGLRNASEIVGWARGHIFEYAH